MTDLNELQNLAIEMNRVRGFDKDSLNDKIIVATGELGELANAVFRGKGNPIEELADYFAVGLVMANLLGMDGEKLGEEVRKKIESDMLRA